MTKKIIAFFQKQSKPTIVVFALISIAVVASIDYALGVEISFSIFYLIPVSLLAWFNGRRDGLLGAAVCAVLWYWMDYLGGRRYSHPAIPYWNAVVRGGFFTLFALSLERLRGRYELEKSNSELKSNMLAVVSHEFGNALTVIKMTTLLLKEADLSHEPEKRLRLYTILDRVQVDLERVVANFLNHARMESGRFALNISAILLRDAVQFALSAIEPLMVHKQIDFHADFPKQPVVVRADRDALSLIMSNLLGNAVKYTPENGRISVGISSDPSRGALAGKAVIWVQDSGIGISREERRSILSGFFRTDDAKRTAKGYGVGLKITQEMVEAHGGSLEFDSEPGKGTRVWFRLPLARPDREIPDR
jgi:signal transduction histidine kinase